MTSSVNISATEQVYSILTPKQMYIGHVQNRSTPTCATFKKAGGIYIGPSESYIRKEGRCTTINSRYALKDSKWFHRPSCYLNEPNRWSGFLFSRKRYTRFIRRKQMWSKLPQLYGKVIGCWCQLKCHCQASVLIRLVRERMKEDFPHVKEEDVAEMRQRYSLSKSECNLLSISLRCLEHKADQERKNLKQRNRCADPITKIRELQSYLANK